MFHSWVIILLLKNITTTTNIFLKPTAICDNPFCTMLEAVTKVIPLQAKPYAGRPLLLQGILLSSAGWRRLSAEKSLITTTALLLTPILKRLSLS